ncbi:unnamed protein product [Lampetra planeri]
MRSTARWTSSLARLVQPERTRRVEVDSCAEEQRESDYASPASHGVEPMLVTRTSMARGKSLPKGHSLLVLPTQSVRKMMGGVGGGCKESAALYGMMSLAAAMSVVVEGTRPFNNRPRVIVTAA